MSSSSERQDPDESPLDLRGSVSISSFLALPRFHRSERPRLFKAATSDDRSLTMKKRHHNSDDHSVFNNSRRSSIAQNAARAGSGLTRSQSLPSLPVRDQPFRRSMAIASTGRVGNMRSRNPYSRRWTLPTKAVSTREVSTHGPGGKYRHHRRNGSSRNSPAIITLRRATTSFGQGTSITFFPPPKLNNSKTSLISHFLNTIVGGNREQERYDESSRTEPKRKFSIFSQFPSYKAVPATSGEVANPTVTKITFEPILSVTDSEIVPYRSRRCSTKYVTRSSIYEIIWDENDTPTDNSELSSPPEPSDLEVRRPSVAATYLEAQLYKSVVQSRRASHALMLGDERGSGLYEGRRLSFQSLLNMSLSRLINESALQRLPRSRASGAKSGREIMDPIKDDIPPNTPTIKSSSRHDQVEVFPPIRLSSHQDRSLSGGFECRSASEIKSSVSGNGDICRARQAEDVNKRMETSSTMMEGVTSLGQPKALPSPKRTRRNIETAPLLDIHIWEAHNPW